MVNKDTINIEFCLAKILQVLLGLKTNKLLDIIIRETKVDYKTLI